MAVFLIVQIFWKPSHTNSLTVADEASAEGIAADYDAERHLAGIEILDALKRFGREDVLRRVVLEDVALARAA